jgi:hypothetical protein
MPNFGFDTLIHLFPCPFVFARLLSPPSRHVRSWSLAQLLSAQQLRIQLHLLRHPTLPWQHLPRWHRPHPVKPSRIKLPRRKVSIAYARIVLDEQQAYFFNNKRKLIAKLPVSTGLEGSTPIGRFKVFSRSAQTFYIPRPQEKMKYMTRFTIGRNGGNIGFHGIPYVATKKGTLRFPTPLGIAPSSHGCIRMLDSHARWVFNNLPQGATVTVVKSRR